MHNIINHENVEFNLDSGIAKLINGTEISFEDINSMSEFINTLSHYEFFIKMEEEQARQIL